VKDETTKPAAAIEARLPCTLNGRYEVERVFADGGGMGVIYDARDLRCKGNRVLVKTTRYDGGQNARHFRYTQDEAVRHIEKLRKIIAWEKKILARFRNAAVNNIPSVNDYFTARSLLLQPSYEGKRGPITVPDEVLESEPFLVMERIHGKPLDKLIHDPQWRDDRLEQRVLQMAREVLTIFVKMHQPIEVGSGRGYFIYQDLKPANILVSPGDYFTLIDMGAVTLRLGDRTTEPTAGCITPGYAAPEADNGREAQIDERFDLYTLGVTMWQVLTGTDPQGLGGDFPELPVSALQGLGLHRQTLALVARALARDPARRYQRAVEMRKAVIQAMDALDTSPREVLQ
jgi:serine/threonine protein kinase